MLFLDRVDIPAISQNARPNKDAVLINKQLAFGMMIMAIIGQSVVTQSAHAEPEPSLAEEDWELEAQIYDNKQMKSEFDNLLSEIEGVEVEINDGIISEGCQLVIPGRYQDLRQLQNHYQSAVDNGDSELGDQLRSTLERYVKYCQTERNP